MIYLEAACDLYLWCVVAIELIMKAKQVPCVAIAEVLERDCIIELCTGLCLQNKTMVAVHSTVTDDKHNYCSVIHVQEYVK